MLTFFKTWPAFHIRVGQGLLFVLTIMRDPQLLFRTLEEPLKSLCGRVALLCYAALKKARASGEVCFECIFGPASVGALDTLSEFVFSFKALGVRACTYERPRLMCHGFPQPPKDKHISALSYALVVKKVPSGESS